MNNRTVYLTRTAVFLPGASIDNDSMEAVLGYIGNRPSRSRRIVLRSNGIRQRHYAIDPITGAATHTNAQLSAQALRGLTGGGFTLDQVECLATGRPMTDQMRRTPCLMISRDLGFTRRT